MCERAAPCQSRAVLAQAAQNVMDGKTHDYTYGKSARDVVDASSLFRVLMGFV